MECKLAVISGMAFEAKLAQSYGIQIIYGLDPAKLEADIENAIDNGAKALLSFGTAAGLSPQLQAGDIVIAKSIIWQSEFFIAEENWAKNLLTQLPGAVYGNMLGVDYSIGSVEEKSSLWQSTKAIAADMESHRVARTAAKHNLPFAVLRVVLDGPNRALPEAALVSVDSDGTINYVKLIRSLIIKPHQLGAMLELAGDHNQAKKALSRSASLLRGSRFGMHFPSRIDIG